MTEKLIEPQQRRLEHLHGRKRPRRDTVAEDSFLYWPIESPTGDQRGLAATVVLLSPDLRTPSACAKRFGVPEADAVTLIAEAESREIHVLEILSSLYGKPITTLPAMTLTRYVRPGRHGMSDQQVALLLCDDVPELLFGGAAGPGKTWGVLAAGLQYASVGGYNGLILRKSYPELLKADGILDYAKRLLIPLNVEYKESAHTFYFPEGSSLAFGHLNDANSHYSYSGPSFSFIGIDESCLVPETQLRFMFSRLRRLGDLKIPLRYRLASNPQGVSFRYHKERYIDHAVPGLRAYLPARLCDNLYLDEKSYLESLSNLDPITLAKLRDGDWTVRQSGTLFRRENFEILPAVPTGVYVTVRSWDLASSPTGKRTAGIRMSTDGKFFYVESAITCQRGPHDRDRVIVAAAQADGTDCKIIFEREGGSGGLAQIEAIADLLPGYYIVRGEDGLLGIRPSGPKLQRAGGMSTAAAIGKIKLIAGPWNSSFLDELEAADEDSEYLDQLDAAAQAYNYLVKCPLRVLPMGGRQRYVYDLAGNVISASAEGPLPQDADSRDHPSELSQLMREAGQRSYPGEDVFNGYR